MPVDIALSVIKQKYTTPFIKWLNRRQEVIRAIKRVKLGYHQRLAPASEEGRAVCRAKEEANRTREEQI